MNRSGDPQKPENLSNNEEKTLPDYGFKKVYIHHQNLSLYKPGLLTQCFLGKRFEEPDAVLIQGD